MVEFSEESPTSKSRSSPPQLRVSRRAPETYLMNEQDIVIREFLAESYENLDQLERDLVTIEVDPRNRETLDRIFRTVYSIKGACGFLAYPKLEAVAHAGEGLLCRLRDGELEWRPAITSA